ncbi:MAG: hypothetical protein DMF60_00360 [Acidobacteria bacterium]|nr:MAG: hypothetical protein DMF60_00360 [Acidobacteriota bacterium]
MNLDALIWVLLPVFVAAGSALLSYYIMQARMEVAIAKERESLAEANALINSNKVTLEERIRAAEEATRRKALDDFMQEFRVEERHYFRENKSISSQKKAMILQERLYFRNIPLSNWVEHEMLVEDNVPEIEHLARGRSVFNGPKALPDEGAVIRMPQPPAAMGHLT